MANDFLPISKIDMESRGWDTLDFVCVTGDAYVDHPSFGIAIISRLLESMGYRVGIIAQPNWQNMTDFMKLGRPKLGFFVTSGNIDSMVAHYTAAKKPRSDDAYSPGGKAGKRPDRAAIVYTNKIRQAYGDIPIIIGGLEASLRRFAHYDYWQDTVRASILIDSGADLLVYGMGENQTRQIAERLSVGENIKEIRDIKGTCYITNANIELHNAIFCPSYDNVKKDKKSYALSCKKQYEEQDFIYGRTIIQPHNSKWLIQNPPMPPLTQNELDPIYSLPYMRTFHPIYKDGVPATLEVQFSITHTRGCFGACNFCSLAFHQGRRITTRSKKSIIEEATLLTKLDGFKGYIHDVGGPTANFRQPSCSKQIESGLCKNKKCLAPVPCGNLEVSHDEYLDILREIRKIPKIKKVFVRSGIRFDYLILDKDESFFRELVEHHISGQLKVAPEHCSEVVLDLMGKPHIESYMKFAKRFYELTKKAGKEQYLVPYLMSSHPGSGLKEAVELALFLKRNNIKPEQVQDFYPTPGTISTCMFYTGMSPITMKPVYVPDSPEEKAAQRALLQYFKPQNQKIVRETLKKIGRNDLIGFKEGCLVKPETGTRRFQK
jgi:uncharacterized radical SAM protein YgiQ